MRLLWAAFYWNARKTVFRLRGSRGQAPCQAPSDSGRAGETRCDASLPWHQPHRFRRVCPLLKRQPNGEWSCSVHAAEVRPFWGRAAAIGCVLAVAGFLITSAALYGTLRTIGYEVSYRAVAWPPAWHEITLARSDFFYRKALAAQIDGKPGEALLALSVAYELNPANHTSGRLLAALCQISHPHQSNQVYQRLLHDHPPLRDEIAHDWFRALLARQDYPGIQRLAAERLLHNQTFSDPWLQALLFASRQTQDSEFLAEFLAEPSLPPSLRPWIELATRLETSPANARPALLHEAASLAQSPFHVYLLVRQALRHDLAREALGWLESPPHPLPDRERRLLRLDTFASLGWQSPRSNEFDLLLRPPTHAAQIQLLATHLVRHPDPELHQRLLHKINSGPPLLAPEDFPSHLILFCLAASLGQPDEMERRAPVLRRLAERPFLTLDAIIAAYHHNPLSAHLTAFLPALQPLPLEFTYALLDSPAPR